MEIREGCADQRRVISNDLNQRSHLRDTLGIPNHARDRRTRRVRSSADGCRSSISARNAIFTWGRTV
jgi:hypothetical protein